MGSDEDVIAGVGLRRGCGAAAIVALVRQASAVVGRPVTGLAAPSFKRGEAGLMKAAAILGVEVIFVDDAPLRAVQGRCETRSALAERAVGVGSVAEGCALVAGGTGSRLVLARIAAGGATCALAEGA